MTGTKEVIILMTALLPTTGHSDLIKFAQGLGDVQVRVLINSRDFEPITGTRRLEAFEEEFKNQNNVTVRLSEDNSAPQNPGDHPDFWNWWKNEINKNFPEVSKWDYVVASEPYGFQVAEAIDANFMPYDIDRVFNPIKSTVARLDIENYWDEILPAIRRDLSLQVVMFGQESVGKTTMAKLLAQTMNGTFLFEYARPYLETVGIDVTPFAMDAIHRGQGSIQRKSINEAQSPLSFRDTDLFSTVGYWDIMNVGPTPKELIEDALELKGKIYYLLPDDAPFEVDPIRYGGDKRESSTDFWENILVEYGLPFVKVPKGTLEEKRVFIESDIRARQSALWSPVRNFLRD